MTGSQETRKVRKGTKSCWACKRKKVKCIFQGTIGNGSCLGCRRTGSSCVLQDHSEESAVEPKPVGERIGRIEELVEALAKNSGTLKQFGPAEAQRVRRFSPMRGEGVGLNPDETRSSTCTSILYQDILEQRDISENLYKAWPTEEDLHRIITGGGSASAMCHGIIFKSYEDFVKSDGLSPSELLRTPEKESHPVLIARKLLLLAAFIQGLPASHCNALEQYAVPYRNIMQQSLTLASRLVNSNDDFAGSVEHIECLMIESMYHNNAGNIRRAYMTLQRALTAARILRLDRGAPMVHTMILELKTKDRIDLSYMWFRIKQSDHYLSLMLGVRSGASENAFSFDPWVHSDPIERLERLHCAVGGCLAQRNQNAPLDLLATQEMDKALRDAALWMPAQWWLIPDFATIEDDNIRAVQAVFRLTIQLVHYYLLTQLHFPYLMHDSNDLAMVYSRTSAIQASREIMSRFISCHNCQMIGPFCQGIDILAFISVMTICLAHIDHNHHADQSCYINPLKGVLYHQHQADRGMMEQILEIAQNRSMAEASVVSSRIAKLTERLLWIEAASSTNNNYKASQDIEVWKEDSIQELGCNGRTVENDSVLLIHVPHFGTIRFEPDRTFLSNKATPAQTQNASANSTYNNANVVGDLLFSEETLSQTGAFRASGLYNLADSMFSLDDLSSS